jgi:DNA-binding beta-propeller fold protein YncE
VIIPTFRPARRRARGGATLIPGSGSKHAPMESSSNARRGLGPVAAAGLLALAACTASSEEVRPPQNELFFPTGVVVSPDESRLFVTSANSELRYDSGVLSAVDLAAVDAIIEGWLSRDEVPAGCRGDLDFSETLVCDDAGFLLPNASVRTGNFATAMSVQDLGDGNLRLVIPVRGDPSVTWVDWRAAEGRLSCAEGSEGFALCDDEHRLTEMRNDGDLPDLVDEPFGVYADSASDYAVVTHLTEGGLTLVDSPRAGIPQLADALLGVFAERGNLVAGAVAVAGRTPGQPGNLVYVAGRTENKVVMFSIERPPGEALPLFVPSDVFRLQGIGTDPSDTRGLAFDAAGDRMFVVNRVPPMLHVYDTSIGGTGYPKNTLLAGADLCSSASNIAVADPGDGERVFVSCFNNGQIWVVDPRGGLAVESFVQVGRGPYGVAVAPGRRRLYVSNFLEDTLAVIDLTPGAATRNRVVLRIGEPRP